MRNPLGHLRGSCHVILVSVLLLSAHRSPLPKASKAVSSGLLRYSSSAKAAAIRRIASRSSRGSLRSSAAVQRLLGVVGSLVLMNLAPKQLSSQPLLQEIAYQFANRPNLLGLLVGDSNLELLFGLYHQLDDVERGGAEILDEGRRVGH